MDSIHHFKAASIEGGTIDFAAFGGKKILVVNVASECGYTPQYQQLQALHEQFGERLAIVGFPCNDFGGQEPQDEAGIQAFCSRRFGVSFPLAAKIRIKGPAQHPIYAWLCQKAQNGVLDAEVRWNFHKFLLDEEGRPIAHFPSAVEPADERLLQHFAD